MRHAIGIGLLVLLAAACSSDGDDSARETTPAEESDSTFVVTSPAFEEGEPIPDRYALQPDNVSPPLDWAGVPAGTAELAIVVVDPDASNFVHWVIAGIDPSLAGLSEGEVPSGASQALTGFDQAGYGGPAPPPGDPHTYVFTLYALGGASGVDDGMESQEAIDLIEGAATARAELRGTFQSS